MSPLVSTIVIARRPDEVYAFATDPRHFAEWQRDVVGIRMLGDSKFSTTRRFAGAKRTLTQEIIHDDPPHRWSVRSIDGPIRASATITIEPLDNGTRSRVTFRLDLEGRGIGVTLMPLVRRQAEKGAPNSYRNLKQLLESR
jgi:uncharacterized protein YndB with AHSA1/START domain